MMRAICVANLNYDSTITDIGHKILSCKHFGQIERIVHRKEAEKKNSPFGLCNFSNVIRSKKTKNHLATKIEVSSYSE